MCAKIAAILRALPGVWLAPIKAVYICADQPGQRVAALAPKSPPPDEDHPRHEQHESRVPPWDSGITTAEAAPSLRFLQEPALSNAEGVGISAADTMGVWLVRWTRP